MASMMSCVTDMPMPEVSASTIKSGENVAIMASYGTFFMTFVMVATHFSDCDYSTTLTISSAVQCLAFFLLTLKVKQSNSVAGLSSKCLELYLISLFFRLSSTLVKNGYIPIDRTGDIIYQLGDVASLLLVVNLLYKIHRTHKDTYQQTMDSMNVWPMVPPCLLLAICFHGHLNRSFFFDVLWFFSLNVETLAMLPQLFMLTKIGGEVEGMMSHFIFCIFLAKVFAWLFWYVGYPELADGYKDEDQDGIPEDWGTYNGGGYALILMYTIQLLGSADFVYYYVKAQLGQGKIMMSEMEV